MDGEDKQVPYKPLSPHQNMALIECALHFPFQKLSVSDFPLQRLLILMAIDRYEGDCETTMLLERLPAFTKASVSRHLKALRELGLVQAHEVSEDLRRKSWRMTRNGMRFMNEWRAEVTMLRDMMLHVRAREDSDRAGVASLEQRLHGAPKEGEPRKNDNGRPRASKSERERSE